MRCCVPVVPGSVPCSMRTVTLLAWVEETLKRVASGGTGIRDSTELLCGMFVVTVPE